MFYELRCYNPAPGRLPDLTERIGRVMVPFFERHRFPSRLGQWTATAGPTVPLFLWLLRWPSFEARLAAFAALGRDEEWLQLRLDTNGPGEMVRSYDLRFLTPALAWPDPQPGEIPGPAAATVYELRVHPIPVGRTAEAARVLAEVDIPAWQAAGATVLAVFDNQTGPATPGVTLLLGFADEAARRDALRTLATAPPVLAARAAERERCGGDHLLGPATSTLLEATAYGIPNLPFSRA